MAVIEVTTFTVVDGTDEAAFLAADHRMQTAFFHQQPGFLRRTTARASDGEWVTVVLWADQDSATTAGALATEDEVATAFAALTEGTRARHYVTID